MNEKRFPNGEVEFLLNIQRLLDEGQFVATYKFALLLAIADICVERGHDTDDELEVDVFEIAGKFIEYFWNHTMPFRDSPLHFATGNQAAVLQRVAEARASYPTLYSLRRSEDFERIVRQIARIVKDQPLWKLQTVRSGQKEFIYRNRMGGNSITLLSGVCRSFRLFHGLITGMVRQAWVDFVRRLPANRATIGSHCDLEAFLFGESRSSLQVLRAPLIEIQAGKCFYCDSPLRSSADVDHFIPWSTYRRDLGHNFVVADKGCNGAKSSMLAGVRYLESWVERNDRYGAELSATFNAKGISNDLESTMSVAVYAYHRASLMGASLWTGGNETTVADDSWRDVLGRFL